MSRQKGTSIKTIIIFYSIIIIFVNFLVNYFLCYVAKEFLYEQEIMRTVANNASSLIKTFPNMDIAELQSNSANVIVFDIKESTLTKYLIDGETKSLVVETNDNVDIREVMFNYIEMSDAGVVTGKKEQANVYDSLNSLIGDKDEKHYYLAKIDQDNYLIVYIYTSQVAQTIDISNKFSWFAFLWASLIMFPIGLLATLFVNKKIRSLGEYAKAIERHEFLAPLKLTNIRETDEVISSINSMGKSLESYLFELGQNMQEMQKNIEMREETEEKQKTFVSDVSHEIKTPITIIKSYAEAIQLGLAESPEEIAEYTNIIMDECSKMTQMTEGLITLTQVEICDGYEDNVEIDVQSMLKTATKKFQKSCSAANIKISYTCKKKLVAIGNKMVFENVLLNYVQNAYKYCDKPGIISISAESTDEDKNIRVIVYNNGKGIPEEAQPHIWDRFYKIDRARTRDETSTGIGLAIVKAAMTKCGLPYGSYNTSDGICFFMEMKKLKDKDGLMLSD